MTENRLLRNQLQGRVRLTDAERKILAELGMKLGKQALEEVATIVKPDTILAWHRKLPEHHGIPPLQSTKKTTTYGKGLSEAHMEGTSSLHRFLHDWRYGPWCGLTTYDVLFFIRLGTGRSGWRGVTPPPDQAWMVQVARNVTMEHWTVTDGFPAKAYAIENKRLIPSGFRKHKVNRINNICILCH